MCSRGICLRPAERAARCVCKKLLNRSCRLVGQTLLSARQAVKVLGRQEYLPHQKARVASDAANTATRFHLKYGSSSPRAFRGTADGTLRHGKIAEPARCAWRADDGTCLTRRVCASTQAPWLAAQ